MIFYNQENRPIEVNFRNFSVESQLAQYPLELVDHDAVVIELGQQRRQNSRSLNIVETANMKKRRSELLAGGKNLF